MIFILSSLTLGNNFGYSCVASIQFLLHSIHCVILSVQSHSEVVKPGMHIAETILPSCQIRFQIVDSRCVCVHSTLKDRTLQVSAGNCSVPFLSNGIDHV